MLPSLRLGATALAVCACLALPAAAGAATVGTLTGETLKSTLDESSGTVNCAGTPTGTSTMTWDVSGVASGPYTGSFHETGSITFTETTVLSFSAHFTIDSAAGMVEGDKVLDPAEPPGTLTCDILEDGSTFARATIAERYDAQVTGSAAGDFSDSGTSQMVLTIVEPLTGDRTVDMLQAFQSGGPPGTTITLTPETSINPVGTTHTVTATVRDAIGQPVQGVTVWVDHPDGGARCGPTDANGECSVSYTGPFFPRADEIRACADTNANGEADPPFDPCAFASKVWTAPASTTGQIMGGGYIGGSQMSFAVGARAATLTDPVDGHCNANDHVLHIKIRCEVITTMVLTPTHALLIGTAMQDGVATNFEIQVDDLSDLGLPDTFQITTGLGYTNGGPLTGGNVQIRP
jgi:hypothetical protein